MDLIGVSDPDVLADVILRLDSNIVQTDEHALCCFGVRTSHGFIFQRVPQRKAKIIESDAALEGSFMMNIVQHCQHLY